MPSALHMSAGQDSDAARRRRGRDGGLLLPRTSHGMPRCALVVVVVVVVVVVAVVVVVVVVVVIVVVVVVVAMEYRAPHQANC